MHDPPVVLTLSGDCPAVCNGTRIVKTNNWSFNNASGLNARSNLVLQYSDVYNGLNVKIRQSEFRLQLVSEPATIGDPVLIAEWQQIAGSS